MAFVTGNLVNLNSMPPGFATYVYKSDTDLRATVEAVGYFNNSDDDQNFASDDRIIVTGDKGGYELAVLSLSSDSVTTSPVQVGSAPIGAGATLTVTKLLHAGRTIVFDTAGGSVITLPAATGIGSKYRFVVSILATSASHILQAAGDDMMQGAMGIVDTDTSDATIQFAALVGDTFDKITMNRTTTGLAAPGDWIEVEDIVSGIWAVRGLIRADGTVATPFSSG